MLRSRRAFPSCYHICEYSNMLVWTSNLLSNFPIFMANPHMISSWVKAMSHQSFLINPLCIYHHFHKLKKAIENIKGFIFFSHEISHFTYFVRFYVTSWDSEFCYPCFLWNILSSHGNAFFWCQHSLFEKF